MQIKACSCSQEPTCRVRCLPYLVSSGGSMRMPHELPAAWLARQVEMILRRLQTAKGSERTTAFCLVSDCNGTASWTSGMWHVSFVLCSLAALRGLDQSLATVVLAQANKQTAKVPSSRKLSSHSAPARCKLSNFPGSPSSKNLCGSKRSI